jgi:hypothetical protein
LKDLLLKVEEQYIENLNTTDEIQTHQTTISKNQKIIEIFDYKKTLESQIRELEKEIL